MEGSKIKNRRGYGNKQHFFKDNDKNNNNKDMTFLFNGNHDISILLQHELRGDPRSFLRKIYIALTYPMGKPVYDDHQFLPP